MGLRSVQVHASGLRMLTKSAVQRLFSEGEEGLGIARHGASRIARWRRPDPTSSLTNLVAAAYGLMVFQGARATAGLLLIEEELPWRLPPPISTPPQEEA